MPGGDGSGEEVELDVRDVEGPPFEPILAALEDLEGDQALVLINSFEPVPLYAELESRGFAYSTRQVDADEWRVTVEPATE